MSILVAVMRGALPLTLLATIGLMLPDSAGAQNIVRNRCRLPAVEVQRTEQVQSASVEQANPQPTHRFCCRRIQRQQCELPVQTVVESEVTTTVDVGDNVALFVQAINIVDTTPPVNEVLAVNDEPTIIEEPAIIEEPVTGTIFARRDASADAASASMGLANYPNPFVSTTTINYTLVREGRTTLSIFDAAGKLVTTLVDGTVPPGSYNAAWTPTDLPAGIYVARLQCDGVVSTRKLVLNL